MWHGNSKEVTSSDVGCVLCMFTCVIVSFVCLYSMILIRNFYVFYLSNCVYVMSANSNFIDRCIVFFLYTYIIGVSNNKESN